MTGRTARDYDSSRRQEDARRNRQAVLHAAIVLFTSGGYAGTTLQAIADEAGVSVQTIYATLQNKRTVLAEALDVAISGDDQPVTVNDRDWMQLVWTADTAAARLEAYARAVARIMSTAGAMFMVVSAAAITDPELAALDTETQRRRRLGAERVIASIRQVSELVPGLEGDGAVDVLWLLNSPSVHYQLIRRSGWSADAYTAWLADALVRQLLPPTEWPPTSNPD